MPNKKGIFKRLADILNPYAWAVKARNKAFDNGHLESRQFEMPIICIGNITVGGTGKTPHTEYLVNLLKDKGNVAVLSRGYGRKSKGYIKADENTAMNLIGDEPYQIKEKFPGITVAVCEKRVTGVERLLKEEKHPDIILLDDAYQHRHIKAGLYILLVDINRPIWNDCILPFGRLRESAAGARRADVVIMTKCAPGITREDMNRCKEMLDTKEGTPLFFSMIEYGAPYPMFPQEAGEAGVQLESANILLVTGIANPIPLKKELEAKGANVTLKQYADHHNFVDGDIEEIAKEFSRLGGRKYIITTEKDATRLRSIALPQAVKENIHAIPIVIRIIDDKENMFNQIILDYVTEDTRNR